MMSLIVSALALVVSGLSVFISFRFQRATSVSNLVDRQYNAFNELAKVRLANYEVSHIFEVVEQYTFVRNAVKESVGRIANDRRHVLYLKERSMAIFVFTLYENTFYQHKFAKEAGDTAQVKFLADILFYFTNKLLRNPRLLYFWMPGGGSLSTYFEKDTRAHYDKHVLGDKSNCIDFADEIGPFWEDTASPLTS
jgi:hypothetical protein